MKNEIKKAIKTYSQDSTILLKDVPEKLQARFNDDLLFDTISEYMKVDALDRQEWIICIETLCHLDKQRANVRLLDALAVSDSDKRFRVIRVLGKCGCGTSYVVPTLLKMLKNEPNPSMRYHIALTLGFIGDKEAMPYLQWLAENDHSLNYEDVPVSFAARDALKMFNSED